jgi:hypothetical protein
MAHEKTVVALFARSEDAREAIARLIDSGIRPEHIGYLEPLDERELKNPAKGAAEGIAAGATAGAVLAVAAVALIPGLGPALIAGALVPVVMGTITGGVAGGLLGASLGSDEEPYFMEEVQAGRILVSAEVAGSENEVFALLSSSAAIEVDRLGTATLHATLHHPAGNPAA